MEGARVRRIAPRTISLAVVWEAERQLDMGGNALQSESKQKTNKANKRPREEGQIG